MLELINSCFQQRKDFYTHVVLDQYPGTYYLPMDNNTNFFNYYNILRSNNIPLCIAEKMGTTCPILGDVDIKIPITDIKEYQSSLYTVFEQEQLIKHFQNVLSQQLKNVTNENLTCFVLEKEIREENGFVKHGFHLHFPFIFVTKEDFNNVIFPELYNGSFNLCKYLDNVSNKCWLMYGSSKKIHSKPYLISKIYDSSGELNIQNFLQSVIVVNTEGKEVEFEDQLFKLPQILSVNPIGKKTFKLITEKRIVRKQPDVVLNEVEDAEYKKNNLLLASKLCYILKRERAEHYNLWWEIGIILYNIGSGNSEALELFHEFSSQASNYDQNGCNEIWEKFSIKPGTHLKKFGSLVFLCRQDNPTETEKILRNWKIEKAHFIPLTEYRIAYEFVELHPDSFLYCSKHKWYIFDKHIWKNLDDATLYFIPMLIKMSDWYNARKEYVSCEEDQKKIEQLVKKLENSSTQKNIINQAAHLYHFNDVNQLMDYDPNLIAFQNGIYDLTSMEFRDGKPSDFISKKMPITYEKPTNEHIEFLLKFLNEIFPDPTILEYFLNQTCEVFVGGNKDKIAMFWTGNGNNGKSVTQKLFEKMLGPYAVKLPTTVLTGKKVQAGGASPELVRLRGGVRWGVFEEFNSDENIEIGILKHLTGNDAIYARQLYEKGDDFTPMFKMIIICNKLPNLKCPDQATWNRIKVIPFESTFSDKAPTEISEQIRLKHFKCDVDIERHFLQMAKTLAYYLIETLKQKRMGLYQRGLPDKVLEATLNYQLKCNKISHFAKVMMDQVVSFEDADKDFEDSYILFRDWWKIHHSNQECPDYELFCIEMERLQNNGFFYKKKNFLNV